MNEIVIDATGIGKRYRLSHQAPPDSLKLWARSLIRDGLRRGRMSSAEDFWALRDVSLQVRQGECLALVGRNGSGKSTLLKILSRVIPPTQGRARVHGRLVSLLEVGTGFHPELTGRENIFLNGAMLGCSRSMIRSRFDRIVAFSGVERFLDTPVKHYSSGMYVRLAYAVAAHVEADILLIDEVLAVGDAEFQERCLQSLQRQLHDGVAMIVVSHSVTRLHRLANRLAWLRRGQIAEIAEAESGLLDRYLEDDCGAG